jgi:hypothetical protein
MRAGSFQGQFVILEMPILELSKYMKTMIEARIAGETDPAKLAALANYRIKASPQQLREALRGRVTDHHRFLLSLAERVSARK